MKRKHTIKFKLHLFDLFLYLPHVCFRFAVDLLYKSNKWSFSLNRLTKYGYDTQMLTDKILPVITRECGTVMRSIASVCVSLSQSVFLSTGWLKKSKLLCCDNSLLFWATLYIAVCLSIVFSAITCESLDLESSFFFGIQVHLQNIQVKFIYQGHRIKVKVTGAQTREISSCRPSVTDTTQSRSLQTQWRHAVTASPFQSFYLPAATLFPVCLVTAGCEDFKLAIHSQTVSVYRVLIQRQCASHTPCRRSANVSTKRKVTLWRRPTDSWLQIYVWSHKRFVWDTVQILSQRQSQRLLKTWWYIDPDWDVVCGQNGDIVPRFGVQWSDRRRRLSNSCRIYQNCWRTDDRHEKVNGTFRKLLVLQWDHRP